MSDSKLPFEQQLKDRLEFFREIIKYDGGDFEMVSLENGVLTLRLLGACAACSMRSFTFDEGIKEALLHDFPKQIKDVKFTIVGKENIKHE
ncbi:MAG: NifU family protein [Malacoplasma sp.]|nr:NifU family protein [Malacoplasma sp.]